MIAIDATIKAPIGMFSNKPRQIVFARIDGESGILQHSVHRSTFVEDGRAYLLNVPPGTYVAVAAFFAKSPVGSSAPPNGTGVSFMIGKTGYTTYFSEELVEHTRVTVTEGGFAYMGKYVIDQATGLKDADRVQTHYKNVLAPGEASSGLRHMMSGDYHYRGSLVSGSNDGETLRAFVAMARKDLAGTGWTMRLP